MNKVKEGWNVYFNKAIDDELDQALYMWGDSLY